MNRFTAVCLAVALGFGSSSIFAQDAPTDTPPASPAVEQTAPAADEEAPAPAVTSAEEQLADLKGKVEAMEEPFAAMNSTVEKLSKIKISGYLQAQYRTTMDGDTTAMKDTTSPGNIIGEGKYLGKYNYKVGDFSGGTFGAGVTNLLQVRRARIKVAYETALTQSVVQFDCLPFSTGEAATEVTSTFDTATKKVTSTLSKKSAFLSGGGVTIKDAYLRFADPWTKSIALKGGVYDRPFGFEIGYSSSNRESPERSRIFQTLFPGERDLGVSLEYLPGDNIAGIPSYLNLKVGAFTGNGINIENDNNRDIIGRLGFSLPLTNINLGIDGGFSGYTGAVNGVNDTVYTIASGKWVATTGNKNKAIDRQYVGGDLQLTYGLPVIGGCALRGEYISIMNQPGYSDNNGSPKSDLTSSNPIYSRKGSGYYLAYIQNFDPLRSQVVVKYDSYDPNSDVSGADVSNANKLGKDELAYTTTGLGWIYHWDENVKLVAYYDMVKNETCNADYVHSSSMKFYTKELMDDVFTFRIQYKF
jgi:hypothetical protein